MSLNQVIIGLDDVLSPVWCQAMILTSDDFLSCMLQETNFNAKIIKTKQLSLKKKHFKSSLVILPQFVQGRWVKFLSHHMYCLKSGPPFTAALSATWDQWD